LFSPAFFAKNRPGIHGRRRGKDPGSAEDLSVLRAGMPGATTRGPAVWVKIKKNIRPSHDTRAFIPGNLAFRHYLTGFVARAPQAASYFLLQVPSAK
jgi:hypothetical protein